MLRRRVEFDIAYAIDGPYLEGLNRAVQILVIDSVLTMITGAVKWREFISNEENAVVTGIGFDPNHRRTSPSHDGWLLSHGRACGIEAERLVDSNYGELLVRSVVIHVALVRMSLAPGAFVRDDVIRFGKIGRPLV